MKEWGTPSPFAVFLTIISSSLPQSSDTVPVLSIYIMIQLFVGTISVLLSSWESRAVGHKEEVKVPWYMNRIALLIRRKWCNKKTSATEKKGHQHSRKTNRTNIRPWPEYWTSWSFLERRHICSRCSVFLVLNNCSCRVYYGDVTGNWIT